MNGRLCAAALCAWLALGCATSHPAPHPARDSRLLPPPSTPEQMDALWHDAQAVFEKRCVVCHGCYDAPCQLKLDSFEGVARGASEQVVYDAARLTAAAPTRLFVDAHGPRAWREKGFHPVLAEGDVRDPRASVLLRMLDLKRAHPLAPDTNLADAFSLDLDRKQTCPTSEKFDEYAQAHPLWGMPYALPALSDNERNALVAWAQAGAPAPRADVLPAEVATAIARWEQFLNDPSAKGQLMARYIYEHLFLASLYFEGKDDVFLRLVRSTTPSGSEVDEIATRRPFDDPGKGPFYYRLVRRLGTPLAKTQMPYALSDARLARWRELFITPEYSVDQLPSYDPEVAANPFRAFAALPVKSRYRFMLDEAQFTIMGFIKGPVCRGQVALDVIQDRFWIAFLDPDAPWLEQEASLLAASKDDLDMPAEDGSTALPTRWFGYASKHARYVQKKSEFLSRAASQNGGFGLDSIWNGDDHNSNAALTVFRHYDSASVVRGFVGGPAKTAWIIGYPLLERIHYLLVAGFDVFGNVGHQLTTRLYMDFLRMEGEYNFLIFLPPERRRPLVDAWYRGASDRVKDRVYGELASFSGRSNIEYKSETPEQELFTQLAARLKRVRAHDYDLERIENPALRMLLQRLAGVRAYAASRMPEIAFVTVENPGGSAAHFTILRDSAHINVAQLFDEQDRRIEEEDALDVVPGFLGAYPNALFLVPRGQLGDFVAVVEKLNDPDAYRALRERFGVLRTSASFWRHTDAIQAAYAKQGGRDVGLFDYNRLEAY
jgi:hypothetical protein